MKHNYTKGPWHIGMRPGLVYGTSGEQVADMRGSFLSREENAANARLVASAPEILEALERFANEYESAFSEDYKGTPLHAIFRSARKAILKAKGEA